MGTENWELETGNWELLCGGGGGDNERAQYKSHCWGQSKLIKRGNKFLTTVPCIQEI